MTDSVLDQRIRQFDFDSVPFNGEYANDLRELLRSDVLAFEERVFPAKRYGAVFHVVVEEFNRLAWAYLKAAIQAYIEADSATSWGMLVELRENHIEPAKQRLWDMVTREIVSRENRAREQGDSTCQIYIDDGLV